MPCVSPPVFFYDQLTQTEAGKPALEYLTGRGYTPTTIKQFGLGYALDRWDALLKEAEQNHIAPEMLEKAGLVLPRKEGKGHYDRFRGRAIFPIFSHVGKVLGFGGLAGLGLCPFHHEKTPSFSVNPSMGIYKCFGCGQGGNAFQFVMQMESIGFPEAARMLAERAGIPLPEQEEDREQASEIESIYHALRFAARFFYDQLTQTEIIRPPLLHPRRLGHRRHRQRLRADEEAGVELFRPVPVSP